MPTPGSREPPRTSAATARNNSTLATHSAASPPAERRAGHRSDNASRVATWRRPHRLERATPPTMHVALNAQLLSFAESYRSGGISRVIYHLLAELGRDGRGHTFDVFVPSAPTANSW